MSELHESQESQAIHDCREALAQVQEFLRGELPENLADVIRAHLSACEPCLQEVDVEAEITRMIRRAHPCASAPQDLRMRITSMRVRFSKSE